MRPTTICSVLADWMSALLARSWRDVDARSRDLWPTMAPMRTRPGVASAVAGMRSAVPV
jgi:hypothetical protein